MAQKIIISSQFDGGNVRCLDSSDPMQVKLHIEKDNQSNFFQWFYFRASGVANQNCQYQFTNTADAAYLDGWKGYQAVASYDRQDWFRVPTSYQDGVVSINHKSEMDSIYYAYFAPYSMQRHDDFIAAALEHPRVQLDVLGHTLDGRDLDQLIVGEEADGKKKLWIHGRQHPGETQASWWAEGFISRLLDDSDAVSQALLAKAVFYITPNMNPDGSFRGHLRTNAVGSNLNREWLKPSMEKSPEVYLGLKK
ncbi:MAG: M14-type cytosolic carboxypeptidase [Enterobacterales bacterium]|nr:M14-type cytosolic carboxypeptidase [Enterobacterales bacterium]